MTGLRKVTGLTRGERGEDERLKKMTGAMVWGKRNVTVSAKAVGQLFSPVFIDQHRIAICLASDYMRIRATFFGMMTASAFGGTNALLGKGCSS